MENDQIALTEITRVHDRLYERNRQLEGRIGVILLSSGLATVAASIIAIWRAGSWGLGFAENVALGLGLLPFIAVVASASSAWRMGQAHHERSSV